MAQTKEEAGTRKTAASSGGGKRVTVNLRESDDRRLREIAQSSDVSLNDAIRKALATEAFVQRTLASGRKILVEDENGKIREVEFVK